jgi:hypothetical protein
LTGVCRYDQLNTSVDVFTNVAQTHVRISYQDNYERWVGIPFDDMYTFGLSVDTRPNAQLGGGGYANTGKGLARFAAAKGNEVSYGFYVYLKPIDRLTIEPRFDYQRMTRPRDGRRYFNGYITRTRVQFQATRALSVRLVLQYNDFGKNWDIDPLMTYRLSPFSVVYVGSSVDYGEVRPPSADPANPPKWRNTARQFFMKIQYLFQT